MNSTSISAIIRYNGLPDTPVTISESANSPDGIQILDSQGRNVLLPPGVTFHEKTLTFQRNGETVGSLFINSKDPELSTNNLLDNLETSGSQSSNGSGSGADNTVYLGGLKPLAVNDSADSDSSSSDSTSETTLQGSGSEGTVTATYPDGMWRPKTPGTDGGGDDDGDGIPNDKDPDDDGDGIPDDQDPDDTDDGTPDDPGTPTDEWHDKNPGGGPPPTTPPPANETTAPSPAISTVNEFAGHEALSDEDMETLGEILSEPGKLDAASKIVSKVAGVAGILSNFAKGPWAKGLGAIGIGASAFGLGNAMWNLGKDFSWGGVGSAAMSYGTLMMSIAPFMHAEGGILAHLGAAVMEPHILAAVLIAIAVIYAISAWIKNHGTPKQQAFDVTKDPSYVPTSNKAAVDATYAAAGARTDAWDRNLPTKAYPNVYYIMTLVTGLVISGIGIDLSSHGPMDQLVPVSAGQRTELQRVFQWATGVNVPEDLADATFIKTSDNPNEAERILYVEKNVDDDGYTVHMNALNRDGVYVGEIPDLDQRTPFFIVNPQTGKIKVNPVASAQLAKQRALTQAGNSTGVSPDGAATAVQLGGETGHTGGQVELPTAP